jgi:hypothetical protein
MQWEGMHTSWLDHSRLMASCRCWLHEHLKLADLWALENCMSSWRLQMLIYEQFKIPWAIAGLEMLIHEHLRIADALKIQRSFKETVSLMSSWAVLLLEMYTKCGSNEECLLFPRGWDVQGNLDCFRIPTWAGPCEIHIKCELDRVSVDTLKKVPSMTQVWILQPIVCGQVWWQDCRHHI